MLSDLFLTSRLDDHIGLAVEVSKVMSAYTYTHESWEDNISEEVQWAKINIDKSDFRKISELLQHR
jgi:hypothetical protein